MDIDEMKVGDLKALVASLSPDRAGNEPSSRFIGQYVIARCRDAGVHAGYLVSAHGQACSLSKSRRLWFWRAANNSAFLSGVAAHGLADDSKLGTKVEIDLTEVCEMILCSAAARDSIEGHPSHEPD